jgi:hypothetical protein
MAYGLRLPILLIVTSFANSAFAAQSIVGKWAPSSAECSAPPAIMVGPKSLVGEDFYCRFDTARRRGLIVTWTGSCTFGDTKTAATFIAKTSGKKLFYRYVGKGGWTGPFMRCK